MTAALERAHLVRSVAEVLSSDTPIAQLWPRCCSLLAALAGSERVTIALREPTGDRIAYVFSADAPVGAPDAPIHAGTLAGDVLDAGETIVRGDGEKLAVGVPIHFGRTLFGAICFDRIAAYDAEDVTLLESCALYAGARLYHENAVQSSERYARLAFSDGLTGIANRRNFDETFAREWARALRDRAPVGVLMLDLDFFKSYNDGYGHQSGDSCLQRVAAALSDAITRPTDLVARYGGEEFVALLPDTDLDGAIAVAENLRAAVAALDIAHEGSSLGRISLSIGVAGEVPSSAVGSTQLLHAADDSLYRAKLGGRNRVYAPGYESRAEATRPRRMTAGNNLPVALTRLIGRRQEIGQARALVADHRLVSIVGTGGTGKTRAAIAVASEIADRFEDGAWFVDLSPISDPAVIASTIGTPFSVLLSSDDRAGETLAVTLEAKNALLVVDNCEHLVAGVAELIGSLLRRCPHLSVIATSREPLGIAGEAVYRLPLLSLPPPSAVPSAGEAMAYDAVALFVERATEANRSFALDDDNASAVVQICRDVDGIALAIELAASRIGAIGLATLAQRLHDFRLLDGGDRSAVPRQRTMHAMIGWSYDLLSETERALFRRLAIFSGGLTFDSATAVCTAPPVARSEVFELLSGLIQKSLVTEDASIDARYRLLEPTRAFARERLVDAGELASTARLHAEYFAWFARASDATYRTTPSHEWIQQMEPDIDNLRAALEWSLDERGDVLLGASIAASTTHFFNDLAPGEGVRTIRKALELLPPGVDPPTEARLSRAIATGTRNMPAAVIRAAGERAVEIYRGLDDRAGLAEALRGLAQLIGWYFREEREFADELACESIEIARTLDDPVQLAISLRTRGLTIAIAEIAQKRTVLEESLALMRRHGNDRQIGTMLTWISDFEFSAGDWPRAFAYGREAVGFAESSGSNQLYSLVMSNLALYAGAIDEWDIARNAVARSIASSRKTRQHEYISFSVQAAAVVAAGNDRLEDAARLIAWCDVRVGALHAGRQADQSEEITHRRLLAKLRERLSADELARLASEGAMMNEDEAFALALTV
jgi:diguanylate cyclase (GGDEF)-like protein